MMRKSAETNTKITYADISKATGVSKITLSRMSSKRGHSPSAEVIEKLCIYFNITPEKLMSIVPDTSK